MITPPRSPVAGPVALDYDSAHDIGRKETQEDSGLIFQAKSYITPLGDGTFSDEVICEMSQIILMDELLKIQRIADATHGGSGSTFCAAVLDAKKEKVTIANLGDSRAMLVVQDSVTGKHFTISLSEDHKASSARIKEEVSRNIIAARAIGVGLEDRIDAMSPDDLIAYVGRDTVIFNKKNIPDVTTFDINEVISKSLSALEGYEEGRYAPVSIIVTSDGILDELKSDYNIIHGTAEDGVMINNTYYFTEDVSSNEPISGIYDKGGIVTAERIVRDAKGKGVADNMTVVILGCDRTVLGRNLAGIVCDGHGSAHSEIHNTSAFIINEFSKRADLVEEVLDKKLSEVKEPRVAVARPKSESLQERSRVFSRVIFG